MDFGMWTKTAMESGKRVGLKSALVGGASAFALTAALSFTHTAHAADAEISGTLAAPNNITGTIAAGADDINDANDDNAGAGDAAFIDINVAGQQAITNIDINAPAAANVSTLAVIDSNNDADATLAIGGFIDITTGKTFTLVVGSSEADGTGTDALSIVAVTLVGDIADGGDNATQGGNLIFLGATNEAGDGGANTFNANGDINLTGLTVQAGDGGAAENGSIVTFTAGNAAADTIAATAIAVTGGAGGANAGAAATLNVTGTLADPSGGITVTGGLGATGVGGAAA